MHWTRNAWLSQTHPSPHEPNNKVVSYPKNNKNFGRNNNSTYTQHQESNVSNSHPPYTEWPTKKDITSPNTVIILSMQITIWGHMLLSTFS